MLVSSCRVGTTSPQKFCTWSRASVSPTRLLLLAGLRPGWRSSGEGGRRQEQLVGVRGEGEVFYPAWPFKQYQRPATVVHALVVDLQEAGGT